MLFFDYRVNGYWYLLLNLYCSGCEPDLSIKMWTATVGGGGASEDR